MTTPTVDTTAILRTGEPENPRTGATGGERSRPTLYAVQLIDGTILPGKYESMSDATLRGFDLCGYDVQTWDVIPVNGEK